MPCSPLRAFLILLKSDSISSRVALLSFMKYFLQTGSTRIFVSLPVTCNFCSSLRDEEGIYILIFFLKTCWHASLAPCFISSGLSISFSCLLTGHFCPFRIVILHFPHLPLPPHTDFISIPASEIAFMPLVGLSMYILFPIGSISILIFFIT